MTDDMGSIGARILFHAAARPQSRAFVCDGEALSFAELIAQARRTAGRLRTLDSRLAGVGAWA